NKVLVEQFIAAQGRAPRELILDVDASDVPLFGGQELSQFHGYSWDVERRVVTRLEYGSQGTNPRFVVTNLDAPAADLYDRLYCQRGEAENRIKEAQLDLFGTRASCHKFLANWLRLMFAALAYTLMQRLREIALAGTELARATAGTIRVRLLKIGAAILRNTRRVRIMLASNHPLRAVFLHAAGALSP
ncbi:MAG: transposase, partial [Pseudomonadota bacterium]